jgi:ubiquitin-conjugating enzyme E2 W
VRLQISNSLPPGIELVSADNLEEWLLDIKVLDTNQLYQNETYRLKFRFSSTYPIGMLFLPCPMQSARPSS